MSYKYYKMNSNLSTKNSTMPRRRILKNACISKKRGTQAKKNSDSGTKKTMMTPMIKNNTKTRRKSGTIFLTGSSIRTLYFPLIYPPQTGIPLQIPWKLDPVLSVWSNYESKGGEDKVIASLPYNYHFAQVIGYGLLQYTLLCDYRDSPGDFGMIATAYVAYINRDNTGYIYN